MANQVTTDMYLDALDAFNKLDIEVKEFADTLNEVANALRNQPGRFVFEDVNQNFPIAAGLTQNMKTIAGSHWKTAEEIHQLLERWHSARLKVTDFYSNLPKHRQSAVSAPPNR